MRPPPSLLLAPLPLLAWALAEPHLPVLRRAVVPVLPRGTAPLRVLHLSDLHLVPGSRRRAAWVRRLADLHVDLVVSTGDHLSSAQAVPLLAETLGALTAGGTPGAFVAGNNDYFTPVRPSLRRLLGDVRPTRTPDLPWGSAAAALEGVGWTDLTSRRTTVQLGGLRVALTGTDDGSLRRDRYPDVAGPVSPGADLGIGVTHTPARRLLRGFAQDGHALVLAGHTHGGQVRVPGVGALVTNCDLERARARGLSPLAADGGLAASAAAAGAWLHVSAGLGASPYLPVRVGCRPEATVLTLVARDLAHRP